MAGAAYPWKSLHDAGYVVDFVYPFDANPLIVAYEDCDEVIKEFLAYLDVTNKLNGTLKLFNVNCKDYEAIHFAGGHGVLWNFPDNKNLQKITKSIWESGKIVSAICHGVSGLMNVKLSTGKYLIKDMCVTSFTDKEGKEVDTCQIIPFLLQSELMLRGAQFQMSQNWKVNVIQEGQLITGQNPESGKTLGVELVKMLDKNYTE